MQTSNEALWRAKRLLAAAVALVTAVIVLVPVSQAAATSGSDFDPGYIISDEDFFNPSALTASQTDAFIAGMNKGCLTGRVCLENYKESIKTKAATSRCKAVAAASNQSAGQIIAAVGKACGISPKAILVILQKEQSLVTAQAPGSRAFQAAMGAGCPDTAPCDGKYAGFYEQVYFGASLLKGYTLPGTSNYGRYAAGATSKIAYSPKSYGSSPTCGFKSVYVKNQATHALYVYTPYTPNAKALANLYGTGDSCSAYGNRNFWRLYTDWWGPTGSAGALAIDALYQTRGGATGALGAAQGEIVKSDAYGGGLYQSYSNGLIAWSQKTGAFVVVKSVRDPWLALGGPAAFGWALATSKSESTAPGGTSQRFQRGIVMVPSGGTAIPVWTDLATAYLAKGGAAGSLGWPAHSRINQGSGVYSQEFTGGTLFATTARSGIVDNALVPAYTERGGATGTLGWPTAASVSSDARGGGVWQQFEGGMLISSTTFGTYTLFGTHATAYFALGGVAKLGWPLAIRKTSTVSGVWFQPFELGTIFTAGTDYALVANALADAAQAQGILRGSLGAPTIAPRYSEAGGGGVYQYFTGAVLTRQGDKTVYRLTGSFRNNYTVLGRDSGVLGWPVANARKEASLNVWRQDFQNRTMLVYGGKYYLIGAGMGAVAVANGVITGRLGVPTTELRSTAASGGGTYEHFKGGSITMQAGQKAFFVPREIWLASVNNGGLAGPLGWPIAAATVNSKTGVTSQKFAGGTITYSAKAGATVTLAPPASS